MARRRRTGDVVVDRIHGRALEGNPLGDPVEREVWTYLPPGHASGRRRYPAVLVITGFLGVAENAFQGGYFGEPLHRRLDRLIASGTCPPMVVAVPDCVTALGGSQFVDSPAVGRYETFVTRDVVRHVDAQHPTKPLARHRGICGKSSGGYGALMLGMRRPDLFGALASHSGDAYFDYCYVRDFLTAWDALREAGGLLKWWRGFGKRRGRKPRGDDVHTLNIVAMSACYSPNPDAPMGFDLPFDMETGAMRPDVFRRWKRRDPVVACGRYAENLKRLRGIFVDCGTRDEWALLVGARVLSKRLRELGVKHVLEEFPDNHRSISYRYDRSFAHLGKWLS